MSSINRVILGTTVWHLESLSVFEMPAHLRSVERCRTSSPVCNLDTDRQTPCGTGRAFSAHAFASRKKRARMNSTSDRFVNYSRLTLRNMVMATMGCHCYDMHSPKENHPIFNSPALKPPVNHVQSCVMLELQTFQTKAHRRGRKKMRLEHCSTAT